MPTEPAGVEEVLGQDLEQMRLYVDLLASRGIDWGLMGPREAGRLWSRHILNSVALAGLFPAGASVADVGSGAGLPGLPLAIVRPDLQVTLLESLARRSHFLELAVSELGLAERVAVVRTRAEDHDGRYQVVTARAVAPLPRLLQWCWPLVVSGGQLVAAKGQAAEQEVREATALLRARKLMASVMTLPVPLEDDPTWAVVVKAAA